METVPCDRWCRSCGVMARACGDPAGHAAAAVDVPRMYMLTVYEPWTWAITEPVAELYKCLENRTWPPPVWTRKRWIGLHAGLHYEQSSQLAIGHRLGTMPPGKLDPTWQVRRGRVVAMVRIDGFRAPHDEAGMTPSEARWWFRSQFGWRIGEVFKLPQPVEAKGGQKLRRVTVPAALAVADQLPRRILDALAVPR